MEPGKRKGAAHLPQDFVRKDDILNTQVRHYVTAAKERVYACEKCHIILLHNQLKQSVKGCLHGTKGENFKKF